MTREEIDEIKYHLKNYCLSYYSSLRLDKEYFLRVNGFCDDNVRIIEAKCKVLSDIVKFIDDELNIENYE